MAKSTKTTDAASKPAAKPRKTAAPKTADVLQMEAPKLNSEAPKAISAAPKSNSAPTSISQAPRPVPHEQVAELAHRFWNERGRTHGHHEEDWFRAEQLLRGRTSEQQLRGKAS
ncbi:MAG: DUF2934 domain-containing protein [Terracidiphilus sp.]